MAKFTMLRYSLQECHEWTIKLLGMSTTLVGWFVEKHGKASLKWYGCVLRKDDGYWEKDAEDGVARKDESGKAKKEVYGCGERGHD